MTRASGAHSGVSIQRADRGKDIPPQARPWGSDMKPLPLSDRLRRWSGLQPLRATATVIVLLTIGADVHAVDRAKYDQAMDYLKKLQAETGAPGVSAAVAIKGTVEF